MTDNDRQAAWNDFMQRFVPLVENPEQVLGEPVWQEVTSGGDDWERYWSWEGVPWACSTYDQRDKHSRRVKWATSTHPKAQHLIAILAEDGTALQIILSYWRAADANLIEVNYENGKATPLQRSIETTEEELRDTRLIEEITQATPERLLA